MAEEELREYERQRMEEIRQLDMEELQIEEYSASASSSSDDDADSDLLLINVHDGSVSTSEFTFNTSLASMHTYLGEVDDAHGRLSILEGGKIVKLPMFYLQGVILFPGATLPLKIVEDRFISSFLKALNQDEAPCTIGVIRVVGNYYDSRLKIAGVGTTAQIKQYRRLNDGSINVVARGQQRFKLLRRFTDENSAPCAEVQIIEEETPPKTPKEAFAKLGSFSNPNPNPNPNPSASSSKGNKNKCLLGSSPCSCSGYEKTTDVFDFDESSDEELGLGLNERQNKKRCGPRRTGFSVPLTFWPKWVYEMFDSFTLARRAADLWNEIIIKPNLDSLAKNPVLLSFCIASKLPLSEPKRQELLEMDGVSYRLRREIQLMRDLNHVRCKSCLTLIAKRSDMVTMSNDGPLNAYVNQHGYVHEVITVHNANGLALQGRPVKEHTWFPGYAWTITNCAMCGSNMGWLFTAVRKELLPKSFWGIRSSQVADDTVLDQREE